MSDKITTEIKLSELTPDKRNANEGTERGTYMLNYSLEQFGAGRSILTDKNGRIIAGNKTAEAAGAIGLDNVIVVKTDGTKLVAVQRTDLDLETDDEARQLAYADNRVSEVDFSLDLEELKIDIDAGLDLSGLFLGSEIDDMFGLGDDFLDVEKDAKPNPRNLPIDVIYTLQMADCTCCLAVQAGLKYGIQSAQYRLCPYTGQLSGRHKVEFIDNDYFKYDHQKHLKAVRELKPKYATVRDYMSVEQCKKDGIEFYELGQILDWAAELAGYAENVIVIPKVDELDKIPEKYMLGYSVPTSHGGTPLPVEAFRERRVHLLGGSWKAQLAHMAQLGDDIVSVDNNYVLNISRFGQFINPDGKTTQLQDDGKGYLTNARYAALALSFGAIGAKINELYKPKNNQAVAETRPTKQGD